MENMTILDHYLIINQIINHLKEQAEAVENSKNKQQIPNNFKNNLSNQELTNISDINKLFIQKIKPIKL